MGSREVDVPEVRSRVYDRDGVEKAFGLLVDLRDDPYARNFPTVAFTLPAQGYLLPGEELLGQPNDRTIAAYQERFRGLPDHEDTTTISRSTGGVAGRARRLPRH